MGGRGASCSLGRSSLKQFQKMNSQQLNNFANDLRGMDYNDLVNQGLNGNNPLQRLVDKLNLHEKPVVLDDDAFDKMVSDNNMLQIYRGVYGNRYLSSDDVVKHTMYANKTYVGDGIHGDGLYFSTDPTTAKVYGSSRMTAVINPNKAKIITESKLDNMMRNDPNYSPNVFRDKSQYALYKGYNVIQAVGGNGGISHANGGEDYYIPLDRSALIFRKNSKI